MFAVADDHVCTSGSCPPVYDSQEHPRLVTPSVTLQAQKHFGCQESCFGGPLEKVLKKSPEKYYLDQL